MTTPSIILIALAVIGFGAILRMLFRNLKAMKRDYDKLYEKLDTKPVGRELKMFIDGKEVAHCDQINMQWPTKEDTEKQSADWDVTVGKWERTLEFDNWDDMMAHPLPLGLDYSTCIMKTLIEELGMCEKYEEYERAREIQNEIDRRNK